MAVTVEELRAVMRMEMKPFMRDLQQLHGVNTSALRRLENSWRASNKRLDGIGRSMARSIVAPMAGIATALGTREVIAYADAWTEAGNKLKAAAQSAGVQVRSLNELKDGANAARTDLGSYVDLYTRLIRSASGVAQSEQEIANATMIVSKAFKAGGASASEQAAGILQLGQALGSGVLQGDELRSLRENAPPLAKAIADEFKTTIAGLKDLGAEGKLTSERVFKAILNAQKSIEAQFNSTNATIRDAFVQLNNEFTAYIGNADQSAGASQKLVAALQYLATNFKDVANTVVQFATILAGALAGRAIVSVVAGVGSAVVALGSFLTALRAGTLAASTFTAALGPLGMMAGLAAGAALAFGDWRGSIEDSTRALAAQAGSAGQIEGLIDDLRRSQDAYKQAISATAGAQTSASSSIVADTKREFEAKKSLLELEIKRQQALVAVKQAELSLKSSALKAEIGSSVATRNSAVERGYSDPRVGDFVRLPDDITGLSKTQEIIAKSATSDEIKRIRAEMELAEIGANKLGNALSTVFNDPKTSGYGGGSGPTEAGGGKGKKKSGKSDAEKDAEAYKRVVEAAQERIDQMKAEALAASMTGEEATRLRMATDLLADAQKNGRAITADQTAELKKLAEEYAKVATEAAAAKLQQDLLFERQQMFRSGTEQRVYDTLRSAGIDYGSAQGQMIANQIRLNEQLATTADLTKEFASGLVSDLMNGTSAAEALTNAFGRLADRLIQMALDQAINQLFSNLLGGAMGGGSSLLGGLFGGGGGLFPAAPVGLFAKGGVANKPSIFAEAGPEAAVPLPDGRRIPVDLRMPAMPVIPKLSAASGAQSIVVNFNPVIDNRGASTEAVARTQQQLDKLKAELPAHVTAAVRKAQQSNVKLG